MNSKTILWLQRGESYYVSSAIRDCKALLNIISAYQKAKRTKIYLKAAKALQSMLLMLTQNNNHCPQKEEIHALVDMIKELKNHNSLSDEEKAKNEIAGEQIKALITVLYGYRIK